MPTPEAPTPEAQAWVDRFTKIWGSQPQAGSWAAYSGVKAWAAAVRAVGDAKDHAAVNEHIATKGYKGETGWWKWDAEHVMRGGGDVPFGHYQIQNGEMVTIFTDPPAKPYKTFKFIKPRWIR